MRCTVYKGYRALQTYMQNIIFCRLVGGFVRYLCSMRTLKKTDPRSCFLGADLAISGHVLLCWNLSLVCTSRTSQPLSLRVVGVFFPINVCRDAGSCFRIWLAFEQQWGLCGCKSAGSVAYMIFEGEIKLQNCSLKCEGKEVLKTKS